MSLLLIAEVRTMDVPKPDCFAVDVKDYVAVVEMNAPPVNAQNRQFREELITTFDILGDHEDVRAIVLTGRGKTFSAGADLKERPNIGAQAGGYLQHNRLVRDAFDAVRLCEKPVIAAINGAAIGAGCVLALCCDILIAAEDSFMAMTEVNVGLAGGVRHIRRFFGESQARYLIFTGNRMSGAELYRMGVVFACVPGHELMSTAHSIAHDIAQKAPLAVKAAKRSFNVTEDLPLDSGYRFEQSQTAALACTEDTKEALAAFAEKRKPNFRNR
jgi:enoyl-CoA hydratase